MKKEIAVVLLAIYWGFDEYIVSAKQDDTYDGRGSGELDFEDEMVLCFMFVFFAICISTIASFLCYVSFLDDRIMKQYAEEGELIEGEVVGTEFTRGIDTGVDHTGNRFNTGEKEHFVSIEYVLRIAENHRVRVRKHLRALECDFFHPGEKPREDGILNPCKLGCASKNEYAIPTPKPRIQIISSRDSFFKSFQFDPGKMLELLVIANHSLSALPARQVHRRISARYRLCTVSFVLAAFLIASFCFRLATPLLPRIIYSGAEDDGGYVLSMGIGQVSLSSVQITIFHTLLVLAPMPCIHCLLYRRIKEALEGEYFETGAEVISEGRDDSSLSSISEFGFSQSLSAPSTFT